MKRLIFWLLKVALSGTIAFIALTGFCLLYYNMPVHYDTVDGVTDYSWECNKFYSRATEGFAWGKTNNEGYLNPLNYSENQDIDILVMGSSHMEAYQVGMDESTAAVLGNLMPDDIIYNIGMSGHDFLVCADNLSAAIDKYKPSKFVLLEISELWYTDKELNSAINETVPHLPSYNSGVIGVLQKNQFFRLLYSQLLGFRNNLHKSSNLKKADQPQAIGDENSYDELIARLNNTVSEIGAQLIIIYHPHLALDQDNNVTVSENSELRTFFAEICKKNKVQFLDMSNVFIENYKEKHILPHGFVNTSIGSGHLNKNGHAMIANAVYQLIEGEK